MELKQIGKRIREKRIEKSWSQEELAERLNLSSIYIGMIERGEKTPKLETFIRIVNCLDISPNEILMDVTNKGYLVRMSKYAEEIEKLKKDDRQRLFRVIEAFLEK